MYRLLLLIISSLLISCSTEQSEQKKITGKLQACDAIIYENPKAVKDSLNLMQKEKLSEGNLAYYNLLWNIMKDKCGEYSEVNTDTTIYRSLKWYRQTDNQRNLCRALLYSAKYISEKENPSDVLALNYLREAEEILTKESVNDINTKAEIFRYIGKTLAYKYYVTLHNYQLANGQPEQYINKSINLYQKIGNERDINLVYLDLIDVSKKNFHHKGQALIHLNELSKKKDLSDDIKYYLYKAYCNYYSGSDNRKVISYSYKIINEKLAKLPYCQGNSQIHFNIAHAYFAIGKIDSVLLYCDTAIQESCKEPKTNPSHYYSLKAYCLKTSNDYKALYDAYYEYHAHNSRFIMNTSQEKVETAQGKARVDKFYEEQAEKSRKTAILVFSAIFIIITTFSTLLLGSFYHSRKKYHKIKIDTDNALHVVNNEIIKTRFINDILKVSSAAMSQILDNVGLEAARLRKVSKESCDSLNDSLNNIRNSTKSDISDITKDQRFTMHFPEVSSLSELSPYEKIILILTNYGYSNKDIADMLSNNQSSIRTMKSKIKDKVINSKDLTFDPYMVFPFLNKEQTKNSEL